MVTLPPTQMDYLDALCWCSFLGGKRSIFDVGILAKSKCRKEEDLRSLGRGDIGSGTQYIETDVILWYKRHSQMQV